MAIKRIKKKKSYDRPYAGISSSVEELLLAALESGDNSFQTGRYLVTGKKNASMEDVFQCLGKDGPELRVADARDFTSTLEGAQDATAYHFPEFNVTLTDSATILERPGILETGDASNSPIQSIEPEYFVFPSGIDPNAYMLELAEVGTNNIGEYLRGFLKATEVLATELKSNGYHETNGHHETNGQENVLAPANTWGLDACKVPLSSRSGSGIKVAVLDTGLDLEHPEFAGRSPISMTFIPGQEVQDQHSHGTHCTGTACGAKTPAGSVSRYGIAFGSNIFIGKVLPNAGPGVGSNVLAGMRWAINEGCEVISMSLGSQSGVLAYYTAAGAAALAKGLLVIAAAGNSGSSTGAPANSPTIMSVAALDSDLNAWSSSDFGKIDIAAPGSDVFSSVPRPTLHGVKTGTSMAAPHVAGCAALWAETSPGLRGLALREKLLSTARKLPLPISRVGAGLVQAPE